MYHRSHVDPPSKRDGAIVHVHGFGISGSYLEPTAARLAARFATYVPDLPGMGRSIRPDRPLDLPGLTRSLMGYCDAVGVEKATFVGNSLGCPIILEVASSFPDRIERAVLVSPAGGPNNQPIPRALVQMMLDGPREPVAMIPIAVRDYLRFGVLQSWSLFKAMNAYPTLERLANLSMPTLVVAGNRDPLVDVRRVSVFAGMRNIDAVQIEGAHALNFSRPEVVAALVEAHIEGWPLVAPPGSRSTVTRVEVPALREDAGA